MIETENLSRGYGGKIALHGLNLRVAAGEILGFLGPNGAGKSTTVKILTGMIKPDGGRASVAGFDVVRDPLEVKKRIGYVPESAALYESLSAREYLDLIASLYHLPADGKARRIEELLDRFDLSKAIDQRLSEFSKGMKQKVLIASALMHRPDVLFLDEPLTGLDANAALVVKELIRGLAAQGAHDLLLLARPRSGRARVHAHRHHQPGTGDRGGDVGGDRRSRGGRRRWSRRSSR